jgi:small subunit ribosomal protein S19e
MGIYEIPKTELIERASKELQKVTAIQPPQWSIFVKTGMSKQRQPMRDDWWFVRAAAVLRRLSDVEGPIGVQKLRTIYGGKKNCGHAPERFYPGSGNILRKVLQQLEKAGFAKKIDKGLHKGRAITPQGLSFLGKIADAYMKEKNIVLPKNPGGELNITELPKEKPAKKARVRKKVAPEEGEAPVESAPAEGAPAAPVEAAPKRKRAPRKKVETQAVLPAPEAAPAPAAAPEVSETRKVSEHAQEPRKVLDTPKSE